MSNVTLTGRPRNAMNCRNTVLQVLAGQAKDAPLTNAEVLTAVADAGYQSTSVTPGIIVAGHLTGLRSAGLVGYYKGRRNQYAINQKGRRALAKAEAAAAEAVAA